MAQYAINRDICQHVRLVVALTAHVFKLELVKVLLLQICTAMQRLQILRPHSVLSIHLPNDQLTVSPHQQAYVPLPCFLQPLDQTDVLRLI